MKNLTKTKVAELVSGCDVVSDGHQNTEVISKQQVIITTNIDFNLFANSVLSYSHLGLVERLEEKLGLSAQDANILQQDMLKFLAVCGYRDSSGKKVKIAPSGKIDEAWHNFILFTSDYTEFCYKYFGEYIHHQPHTKVEKQALGNTLSKSTLVLAKSLYNELSPNWFKYGMVGSDEECSILGSSTDDGYEPN